jgi:hypothetical protein
MSIVNDKMSERPTPETDAQGWGDGRHPWVARDFARKLERERDEAREVASGLSIQEERVNEAQKELSSIHRWIDKNHADGFIDSLTYLQNLERVADNWYDRIDAIETDARRFVRERDEARKHLKEIEEYGTEEINDAVDLRQKLAFALVERDEVQKAVNGLCEHIGVSPANTTLLAVEVLRIQRERDEAMEDLESEKNTRNAIIEKGLKLEKQLREAQEALEYIANAGLSARHIEDYAKEFLSKK